MCFGSAPWICNLGLARGQQLMATRVLAMCLDSIKHWLDGFLCALQLFEASHLELDNIVFDPALGKSWAGQGSFLLIA